MGLFDWLKGKDAEDPSATTFAFTTRDISADAGADGAGGSADSADLQDPGVRAALEQADHLIRELLTSGADEGSAGGVTVSASTQVIVDGQAVAPDDPRAVEAMRTAAAKLRAQGLDEVAADLEARVAAAGSAPSAAAPASCAAAPGSAPSAAASTAAATDEAAASAASAAALGPPPAGAPGDDLSAPPSAPEPPEPPAPPS